SRPSRSPSAIVSSADSVITTVPSPADGAAVPVAAAPPAVWPATSDEPLEIGERHRARGVVPEDDPAGLQEGPAGEASDPGQAGAAALLAGMLTGSDADVIGGRRRHLERRRIEDERGRVDRQRDGGAGERLQDGGDRAGDRPADHAIQDQDRERGEPMEGGPL